MCLGYQTMTPMDLEAGKITACRWHPPGDVMYDQFWFIIGTLLSRAAGE